MEGFGLSLSQTIEYKRASAQIQFWYERKNSVIHTRAFIQKVKKNQKQILTKKTNQSIF